MIAPDLPGHGDSDKPRIDYSLGAHANVLRDLMIALGIERATIVGQSLGGGVAMQLAYQHPQRCERLVLVSSGGLGPEVSWMLRALTLPGAEYLMPVLFPTVARVAGDAVGRRLARLGFRAPRVEQEWRAYVSLTEPDNRQSFVRTLRAVVDPSRPGRQRPRPALPRVAAADADRVGRARPHHPGRPRRRRRTRRSPAAGW